MWNSMCPNDMPSCTTMNMNMKHMNATEEWMTREVQHRIKLKEKVWETYIKKKNTRGDWLRRGNEQKPPRTLKSSKLLIAGFQRPEGVFLHYTNLYSGEDIYDCPMDHADVKWVINLKKSSAPNPDRSCPKCE